MNIDMTGALELIRNKGRDTFTAILDKLSHERKMFEQHDKNSDDIEELLENLSKARSELTIATINYEFAQENELIDYYAYLIKAAQIKFDFLLKKVKEKETELGRRILLNVNAGKS